jgi:putative FmdB family regulatory protein
MPTYQYVCRECETTLSETRSITAPSPTHMCEKCGNKMTQVYNIGAITFNGSGFYSKDK